MTNQTTYTATCRNPGCPWTGAFADYFERADAVGFHRVHTGHNVEMNEDPRV